MAVEFIGMIGTQHVSEIHPVSGQVVNPEFVRRFTRAHEDGGFDKVLVGHSSSTPDGLQVAAYAAAHSERLGFLVAHRPGFVAPTLAARSFASLDQFSGGRVAMHVISGGSDVEQRRDGDWLAKDERYDRTDEYLEVLVRTWTEEGPFDHHGRYYRVADVNAEIRPLQRPRIPIYFGGSSEAAYRVGGRRADVYALWGEPLAAVRERVAEVRALARRLGREVRFSVSTRPIIAPTEAKAWDRAQAILARVQAARPTIVGEGAGIRPQAEGARRLLDFAERADVYDKRLWMPIAAAMGGAGNTTALVGTPEQVAESLLDYYDAGATTLLIRGFDPLNDAVEYGRELIPLVRAEVARRDRAAAVTA